MQLKEQLSQSAHIISSLHHPQVIHRQDIPAINTIMVDGVPHNLGQHQDFHHNKDLDWFIPKQGRFSMSWVRLNPGETLEPHDHPTLSMIIICEGEGEMIGDIKQRLQAGDVITVPSYSAHGFVGRGLNGFWALSVQFEGEGLYEDIEKPRVHFADKSPREVAYQSLVDDMHLYERHFKRGALMRLVNSKVKPNEEVKTRLLEALNSWSNWFQRLLAARVTSGGPKQYHAAAEQHLAEEVGHNAALMALRQNAPVTFWDPIFDASASWFLYKVIFGTVEEKTILMHCVLESSSFIFHSQAQKIFPDAQHFSLHSELDEEHTQMGLDLIHNSETADIETLRVTMKQGWKMMECLTARMADYAKHGE